MVSPTRVVPYQSSWPNDFHSIAAQLRPFLAGIQHRIEHVGSTSVPGLAAKPIIDLDVVVAGTVPHRNHIDFRDFLRSHPVEAVRYAALKLELAHLLGTDRPQYGARKSTMVQDFLAQTRAGASNQPAAVTAGA